jgi:hypothetical protein
MGRLIYRPKRFTEAELNKSGVSILNANRPLLRCKACKEEWQPNLRAGGNLPRGYWQCPHGCNWRVTHEEFSIAVEEIGKYLKGDTPRTDEVEAALSIIEAHVSQMRRGLD